MELSLMAEKAVDVRARQILVVDDNQDAADSLALLLRLGGHHVRVAYSGEIALLLAQQQPPEVVLLDLGLPKVNGFRVAENLRQHPATREALIIAVTGYGQASDRQHSKEAGFDLHLLKPVSAEKLLLLFQGDPTLLVEGQGSDSWEEP